MRSWLRRSLGSLVVSAALGIGAAASAQAAMHFGGGHGGFHGGFHGGDFHARAFAGNYGYRHGGFGYYGGGYPYGYGYGYDCNPLLLPVPPFICY